MMMNDMCVVVVVGLFLSLSLSTFTNWTVPLSLWLGRFTTCWLGWFGQLLISFDINVYGFGWNLEYEVVLGSHAKILFLSLYLPFELMPCFTHLFKSSSFFPLFLCQSSYNQVTLSYNLYSKVVCLLKLLLVSSRSTKYNSKNIKNTIHHWSRFHLCSQIPIHTSSMYKCMVYKL